MAAIDLVRIMLRRWRVVLLSVLIGALLTAGLLSGKIGSGGGVFYTRFDMVLRPGSDPAQDGLTAGARQLAALGGLLARDVTGDPTASLTTAPEATLYGEGVRNGFRVRLPNIGTQFVPDFDWAVLNVEVVGSDPAQVQAEAKRLRRELVQALEARQDADQIGAAARASMIAVPQAPQVDYVAGRRSRVMAGMGLLTLVGALSAAYAAERLSGWRRRRASVRSPAPAPMLPLQKQSLQGGKR